MIKRAIKRLLVFLLPSVPWHKAVAILRRCRLARARVAFLVVAFLFGSTLSALLDGTSMILLVELITGKLTAAGGGSSNPLAAFLLDLLPVAGRLVPIYLTVMVLFLIRAGVLFLLHRLDGTLQAKTRLVIQKGCVGAVLGGDWEYMRDIRVGQRVGAVTEEAMHVAQFYLGLLRTLQSILLATVLFVMALSVSLYAAVIFLVVGLPLLSVLRGLFARQGRLSAELITERQGFYAAITERLSGLLQVKVEDRLDAHLSHALGFQNRLTRLEIRLWNLRALVVALNALIPAVVLLVFYAAAQWTPQSLHDLLYLLAGVGILGLRTLGYVNAATGHINGVTAVAGSLGPVYEVLTIPPQMNKEPLGEPLAAVRTNTVSYSFGDREVLRGVSVAADLGQPLIIKGVSGSGKTTLASILAGLIRPATGSVTYVGASGREYDAARHKPRVGYVTQDIHIFNDTVRNNLVTSDSPADDATLWRHLESVGAGGFISRAGGLDAVLIEAGRSLSGGEKRRLGIARILARDPDLLILDEISSGLDEQNKRDLEQTIGDLSRITVTIVVTHDPLHFRRCVEYTIPQIH